jgi:hypothetical protein
MRIRWTTRIATAAGLLTLIAGIATGGGGGAPHAAARPTAASVVVTTTSSVAPGLSWTHRGA